MLPLDSQVLGVWYNLQIFKTLHLSVPTTLAQLVSDCKTIASHGYLPMYQGAAAGWQNENVYMTLADQNQANSFENAQLGKIPWTSAPLVNAMATWKALFSDGVFQNGALGDQGYPTGADLFRTGRGSRALLWLLVAPRGRVPPAARTAGGQDERVWLLPIPRHRPWQQARRDSRRDR